MADRFPELDSLAGKEADADGVGFIRSSEQVGRGHEEYGRRLGSFDWPNEESGEGKDGTGHAVGQRSWLNE